MYVIYFGFSYKDKQKIEKWNKNCYDSFTTKDSIYIGRLVELPMQWLEDRDTTINELISDSRASLVDEDEYVHLFTEARFFYNKEINKIFSVEPIEDENGLAENLIIKVNNIPFSSFFAMIDCRDLIAYLGSESGVEDKSDLNAILMEKGFLNNYLAVHIINKNSAFLVEGRNLFEFKEAVHFIRVLGDKLGWKWRE